MRTKTGVVCLAVLATTLQAQSQQLASFDKAWTIVKERHWDPKLNGVDWDAVRTELRPQAEKSATNEETRKLIQQMVGKLGQSHFGVIPKDSYAALSGKAAGVGETGIELRPLDGSAVVTSVAPDSPAAKAGVQPGWVITKAAGKEIAPLFEKASKYSNDPREQQVVRFAVVERLLRGKSGDAIEVEFRDSKDQPVTRSITLAEPRGQLTSFGNLPPWAIWYEVKRLPGNIGYFRLSAFFDPPRILAAFGDAVQSCKDCKGFIIDLRGNPGGIGAMAMGMAGWFLEDETPLGKMNTRAAEFKFAVNPRIGGFGGPLAVLVDTLSMSTSEILAGGLQDLKRARVFGERTAGAALPSNVEMLPNGDGFQFAMANYLSASGKALEGDGVTPDVEVRPGRAALLAGRDPAVEAASKWILEEKSNAKK